MEVEFQVRLHGGEMDGGAEGSGLPSPTAPAIGTDPTQGSGTSAWQAALRMGMEINARNRRN